VWDFLPAVAARFMAAVAGGPASAPAPGRAAGGDPGREAAGRQLVSLVCGVQGGQRLPGVLARLALDPASRRARDDLEHQVLDALEADQDLLPRAVAVIEAYYRQRAAAGDPGALAELGDFLYWDEPAAARAAYQAAIRAGHARASLSLARLLHDVLEDEEAALVACQQAAASEDQDLSAEAWYQIALVQVARRGAAAARAGFERVIDTGHPVWAAAAMVGLARGAAPPEARSLYRRAIEEGDAGWSAHASWLLANLLERQGHAAAAGVWQRVIDSGQPAWAAAAFTSLVNLLASRGDAQGLRAAYRHGLDHGNPEALYALVQLGQVLAERGDIAGAHAAWQQAIDAGCEDAGYWRERMSAVPSEEPGAGPGRPGS